MRLNADNLMPTRVGYVPGTFYLEATDHKFHAGPRTWIVCGNLSYHDALYHAERYSQRDKIEVHVFQEGQH